MSYKAGFVGIIGLPNAGKSSLLNHLLNEHLCIVSRKPQATRRRVQGVVSTESFQIVFVDSPGFLKKGKNALTAFIADEARKIIDDVDVLLLIVPADLESTREMEPLLELVESSTKPVLFCMSKSDLKKSKATEEVLFRLSGKGFMGFPSSIKKTKEEDKKKIIEQIGAVLPDSAEPLFDQELYTTEKMRDIAAELIREECFESLEQEIPFGIGVVIESFKEEDKIIKIEASIIVEKENHKGIVIGKGASLIKKIGEQSRKKIEQMLGQKIYLGLHVSHKPNWTDQKRIMKELGYVVE
jgi:GTP-binding protein Era